MITEETVKAESARIKGVTREDVANACLEMAKTVAALKNDDTICEAIKNAMRECTRYLEKCLCPFSQIELPIILASMKILSRQIVERFPEAEDASYDLMRLFKTESVVTDTYDK